MSSAFTDRDNPFGDSRHNQVCHIPGIQFIHQMAPVCIDRIGRDTKFLGYLLRILTLGDAFQHIEFTQGQLFTPAVFRTRLLCAHMCGRRAIVRFAIQHTSIRSRTSSRDSCRCPLRDSTMAPYSLLIVITKGKYMGAPDNGIAALAHQSSRHVFTTRRQQVRARTHWMHARTPRKSQWPLRYTRRAASSPPTRSTRLSRS